MPKTNAEILDIVKQFAEIIQKNKDMLTDLDRPIGDSDHGINMARGFEAVVNDIPNLEGKDIGAIMKTVGMDLLKTVGGASGPLYGTAFMRAAVPVNGKESIDGNDFLAMLNASIEGIQQRGKAVLDEATMIDALIPARDAYQLEFESSHNFKAAMEKAVAAAEAGCEHTKSLVATKGRASYLGERGIGHQDPGATSATLLLTVIRDNA